MDERDEHNDIYWMTLAMKEAAKGGWAVHPNPMVGAVIIRDGRVLGCGYHHGAGKPHAEVEALRDAAANHEDVHGATIYVTLEPCNHFGRTPPCTAALIDAGISRCVVGTVDTDERVRGAGIARLKAAGIQVDVGFLETELYALNAAFFKRTSTGLPYITAKWAMSLDGHIATRTHHARWVTGEEARRDVHLARAAHDAIMVGTQTVIDDDPLLNVRLDGDYRQPLRVILDRTLRIPIDAHVFDTRNQQTVLFTCAPQTEAYRNRGVFVETLTAQNDALPLDEVLRTLVARYGVTTLYAEGGARLLGSLFDAHDVDAIDVYIAPKIIGGSSAPCAVSGIGIPTMDLASLAILEPPTPLGDDIRLRGKLRHTLLNHE